MKSRNLFAIAALVGFVATPALGADAAAGRTFFRAQCALCHSAEPNDNGGAQGPNLQGILGRKAADTPFTYTAAMRGSGVTWDAASMDRFLADPTGVMPGTSMVIPVAGKADRDNLVAYFTALRDGRPTTPQGPGGPPRAAGGGGGGGGFRPPAPPPAAAPQGEPEWKQDAPGRVHRVEIGKLPDPYHSPSAMNFPRVVPRPEGAELKLPAGFKAEVYVSGLTAPREMLVAPNGDVIVAETNAGRLKVLRPSADGRTAVPTVFAQGLQQPYGMAFYPSASNPQWLYVAEVNRVVRYAYRDGLTEAAGVPEIVIAQLSPTGGGHFTRGLGFSPDGRRMYVSVGSLSNFAEGMAKKTHEEARTWDTQHGLGAAWDNEENRAMVRVYDMNGDTKGRTFATGLRNCVGMVVQPGTGDLWCAVNERDALGDDLVPDYATRVKEGAFYGWPWYYMGNREDPRLAGERPDLAGKVTNPDVPFVAHSAATNIQFYTAKSGGSLFPAEYHDKAFVVLHGSWNRGHRTGHKIVTLPTKDGAPTGEYVDFLTGFITEDGNAWGRPVAITVAKDGAMLLADDGANLIYRITYSK